MTTIKHSSNSVVENYLSKTGSLAVLHNEIKLDAAYINGGWRQTTIDSTTTLENDDANVQDLYDPSTAEVIATTHLSSSTDVDVAIEAAASAFNAWSQTTLSTRASYLEAIAEQMNMHFDKLVGLSVLNNGKPIEEAKIDVSDAIACYQFYADLIRQQPNSQLIDTKENGFKLYKKMEAVGVCALIVPWNFPMVTTAWKLAPALATGCTAVLKPSEITLIPELMLGNILDSINLPKGVVNIVPGASAVGSSMTRHPLVDKVSFTGSNIVGEKVMQQASLGVKDLSLELGGKSPIIVWDNVDIEKACDLIIGGIFYNTGQICSATSRLLVHENIALSLYKRLKVKTQLLKVGDGFDTRTNMGPLVSQQQYEQVTNYFDIAMGEGLNLLTGGHSIDSNGYFVEPTIYIDVPKVSRLWCEEIFGPVLVTKTFSSEEDAIALANDSKYALAASIVSSDEEMAMNLASKIRAGHIWINEFQVVLPEAGWGGFKQSGIGRELGVDGLAAYQKSKHILCS